MTYEDKQKLIEELSKIHKMTEGIREIMKLIDDSYSQILIIIKTLDDKGKL